MTLVSLRPQQQGADGVPVERQRAARAAGRASCVEVGYNGNRLRQQLAADRRQPGAGRRRRHQRAAACSPDGGRSRAPATSITLAERHAHPEGRLEPVPRPADEGREALRAAACRVLAVLRLVADAGRSAATSTRIRDNIAAEIGPASTPIGRITSSPAASTSCRSATAARRRDWGGVTNARARRLERQPDRDARRRARRST